MEWGAHKPKMIRVEVSDDNRTYHAIGELNFLRKKSIRKELSEMTIR